MMLIPVRALVRLCVRPRAAQTREDLESRCFVCGLEVSTFERRGGGGGFQTHIRSEHNLWHFLFFLVRLQETPVTEYTGPEAFVAEALGRSDFGFLPVGRALALETRVQPTRGTYQLQGTGNQPRPSVSTHRGRRDAHELRDA